MSLAAYGTMLGHSAKSHDDSPNEILSTSDTFQDELKKTAVASAGALEACNQGHQLAFSIFGRIIFATMRVLKPHRDVEFYAELSSVKLANKQHEPKFQELKEAMNDTYKEVGIKSPRLLFPRGERDHEKHAAL